MFDKTLIPQQNAQVKQTLNNLYGSSGASAEQKSIIDKKLEKIDTQIKDKITNTITISEYFNQLWTQPELREEDKEFVIRKLETIQQNKKLQIQHGEQPVAKSCGNLDAINAAFKMTAFEEYNLQEKIEEFKKKKKLDVKVTLSISTHPDPEVLHALNKVSKSAKANANALHYTAGLIDEEEEDHIKIAKAEDFVRKIQKDKKSFKQSMKEREMSVEKRELDDLERLKKKEKEEEEKKMKEKKERLEIHVKELKHRNEQRQKESDKWEEEYRIYTAKKPLYKEFEDKFKKSVIMPELAERKKKLKEIRDFHKPIAREELDEHEKKVAKALEEFSAKKELQNQKESNKQYKKPEFESKYHQKIVEEASKQRNGKEHEQSEKIKKKERIMEYLQQVKEKHLPTADPAKELELLNLIEKLGKKKEPRSKTADDEERHDSHIELRKKGNDYLLAVKEQVQEQIKRKKEKLQTTKDGIEDQSQITDKNILHSVKSDTTFRKRNYLAELRKENKLVANQSSHVDSILKNKKLDHSERKELLQTEVDKLEEKAKRLELLRKHKAKKPTEGVDDDNEVDQIYINAIRAKLEMLGN